MSPRDESDVIVSLADVTPTDAARMRKKVPQRGVRKRVLGDGEGDICVFMISNGENGIPRGALLPIPEVPRFNSIPEAKRWIKAGSGDRLANRSVIIFRACEVINVVVQSRSVVELHFKAKINASPKSVPVDSVD